MNERIVDIHNQTMYWVADSGGLRISDRIPTGYTEKFAELIVNECMTAVLKESKWYWDKDEFESSNAIQNAARRVKEHFGVK